MDEFVQINPNRLPLIGPAGAVMKRQTTIIPLPNYPYRIVSHRTQHDGNIRAELEPDPSGTSYPKFANFAHSETIWVGFEGFFSTNRLK